MSIDRYPAELVINSQDFLECGWKDILAATTREGYSTMWHAFSAAARQAIEEGRLESGKALWLLADACSMSLVPKSINEPFQPFMLMAEGRTVIPDDFLDTDMTFFAMIVDMIDDHWLKARLSDLVWLKHKPKDFKFALAAIDAYRSIPIDSTSWWFGAHQCWERAINLVLMLKTGADNRLKDIEVTVFGAIDSASHQDGFLAMELSNMLMTYGFGRDKTLDIAQKTKSLAFKFESEGDLHRAREYFSVSAKLFMVSGDEALSAEMTVDQAECWVKEAIASISSEHPSHMLAASFYENAIQTYRTIPRTERAFHRVDERIANLRTHLNAAGEKLLDEMGVISTGGMDISQIVENARCAVQGKTAIKALKAFADLHHGARVENLRESALKKLRNFPLQSMFSSTFMSRDGRVIAKCPGFNLGGELSPKDEITIRAGMIKDYEILVSIVVQGDILPALEILLLEHRLRECDFVALADQSPIVPKGRERLFGKALIAGYDRDFVTALHMLVPQIEHMVRYHLKQAGAKTTNLDSEGIENENGLSTIMDLPEAEKVFGVDLSFEIKALFCDAFGPNLRNELAHGLLDDDSCQSIYTIYAWWFGLKLIFNAYWSAEQNVVDSNDAQENND